LDGLINLIKWEWLPLSLIWSSKYRDITCFQSARICVFSKFTG
jgi:hypothetical protein